MITVSQIFCFYARGGGFDFRPSLFVYMDMFVCVVFTFYKYIYELLNPYSQVSEDLNRRYSIRSKTYLIATYLLRSKYIKSTLI